MKKHLFLLLLLLPCWASAQSNFFVSPTGNNNQAGTLAAPWRTIQHGLDMLSTNDTLNLLSGTFTEKVVISVSGITLRNHVGHSPVIDAMGITSQVSIIEIRDISGITVQGIELKNNIMLDAQGILVQGDCHDITIQSCILHDIHFSANANDPVDATKNAQGIIVYGTAPFTPITNLKIKGNQLYNCRLGYSEGIAINGNVDGFEVSNNDVHDLTNIGIDCIGHEGTCPEPSSDQARNGIVRGNLVHHCISLYAPSGGIYIDGGKNIVVENNSTYFNGYGIEIGCENIGKTTDSIQVRNNLFYDNEVSGLALGGFDYPSGSGKVTNSSFTNNTCHRNGTASQVYGELYLSYSENSIIQNNIFSAFGSNVLVYAELSQPGLFFDYNIVYGPISTGTLYSTWNGNSYTSYVTFTTGSQTNAHSLFLDPVFVSTQVGSVDLHLTVNSHAIAAGNPNFQAAPGEVDMDNEPRVFGTVDCGADEFYTGNGLPVWTLNAPLSISPNPSHDAIQLAHVPANATLTIHDAHGVLVVSAVARTGQDIEIGALPAGVYMVTVSHQGRRSTSKLIKL